jgi:prevent-host-death family protein
MYQNFDFAEDIISVSDLKIRANSAIEDVVVGHATKVITRRGRPAAVIVSLEEYQRLKRFENEASKPTEDLNQAIRGSL